MRSGCMWGNWLGLRAGFPKVQSWMAAPVFLRCCGRAGNQSGDSMGFAVAASRLIGFQSRCPRAHARGYMLALLRSSMHCSMSFGSSFLVVRFSSEFVVDGGCDATSKGRDRAVSIRSSRRVLEESGSWDQGPKLAYEPRLQMGQARLGALDSLCRDLAANRALQSDEPTGGERSGPFRPCAGMTMQPM